MLLSWAAVSPPADSQLQLAPAEKPPAASISADQQRPALGDGPLPLVPSIIILISGSPPHHPSPPSPAPSPGAQATLCVNPQAHPLDLSCCDIHNL